VKLDGATRVWIVSCSVAAVCIFLTGALRASSILGPGTLFGAFTISIAILLFFAIKLATARPRLNLTLAAETIVAIGIFSLIISIAVVLFSVSGFMIEISQRDLTITDMRRFAWPFGEGLAAAAIAPFIATLLRHIESNLASVDSGDAGMADAAREAATLADELKLATANFRSVNTEVAASKDAFETALGSAVRATSTLASTLQTEAERLRLALQRVQAEATGLADASEKSRVVVAELGTGLKELRNSSKEASELLDALGKLIDSVERYIRPERVMS
jgi:methyl-accepting chemotaxis protein